MPTRNVVLTDRHEKLIADLVESGRYQNASEVLREGLRLVEERDAREAAKLKALAEAAQNGAADLEFSRYREIGAQEVKAAIEEIGQRAGSRAENGAGSVMGSFDGWLESIDYRGAAWKGLLALPGGKAQIECVFDKNKGEDEFNRFCNKRVSITGRAIYTGDGQLPERIEVVSIEEIPAALEAIDIRGSLTGKHYFTGWDVENNNIQ